MTFNKSELGSQKSISVWWIHNLRPSCAEHFKLWILFDLPVHQKTKSISNVCRRSLRCRFAHCLVL